MRRRSLDDARALEAANTALRMRRLRPSPLPVELVPLAVLLGVVALVALFCSHH